MNNKLIYFAVLAFALATGTLITGCSSTPVHEINIQSRIDPRTNISDYKSYAWLASSPTHKDHFDQWGATSFDADAEITYLINRELRNRGLSVNTVKPDLLVAYAAGIDMQAPDLKTDPKIKMDTLSNIPKGSLFIVLVDSKTRYVIWAGVATSKVHDQPNTATAKARLDYAVTQILKTLPR